MENKPCAFSRHAVAFSSNVTPVCAYDAARNRKSQSGSTCAAVARFLTTIESLEDVRNVFSADSFSCITHAHFHALVCSPRRNINIPSGRGVPQRVADQIVQRPADCLRVYVNRVYIRLHFAFQSNTFTIGQLGETLQRI